MQLTVNQRMTFLGPTPILESLILPAANSLTIARLQKSLAKDRFRMSVPSVANHQMPLSLLCVALNRDDSHLGTVERQT